MVQTYGIVGASIFGRVWRYCQMIDGVCSVGITRIAEELALDKSTVSRYVARLVADGYLEDVTPDAGRQPHVYCDTGKAGLSVSINARPKPVAQDNSPVAQDNSLLFKATACCTEQQPVVLNNSHIRKGKIQEDTRQDTHTKRASGAPGCASVPDESSPQKPGSRFSLRQCKAFAESLKSLTNPGGYATVIYRSGEADALIDEFLNSRAKPDVSQCPQCKGMGMYYPNGIGNGPVVKCRHPDLVEDG